MAITQSRIKTEKLIEASSQSSSSGASSSGLSSASSITDLEPKGLTDLLPSNISMFSSYKDIIASLASSINAITGNINRLLTPPSIQDLRKKFGDGHNLNQNPVNIALGIFEAAFCGDGEGFDLGLDDLLKSLDYKFDFLKPYNVCGRQKVRNPMDVLIKSVDNMRKDFNTIINLDKRLLKNLQTQVNNFIKKSKLPFDLQNCMLDNALSNMVVNYREGIPPGAMKSLENALNVNVCKKSDKGVSGHSKTLQRTAITPIVSGLPTYDRTSMYAFQAGILNNEEVDNILVMEALVNTIKEEPNPNTIKTLELIAFTKIVPYVNNISCSQEVVVGGGNTGGTGGGSGSVVPGTPSTGGSTTTQVQTKTNSSLSGTSIQKLNETLQSTANASDLILDNIINAHKDGNKIETKDIVNVVPPLPTGTINSSCQVDGNHVLSIMTDDVSTTTNPKKDLENVVELIKIADPSFVPEENISSFSNCSTTSYLARETLKSETKTPRTELTYVDGIEYLKINDDVSLTEKIGSVAEFLLSNVSLDVEVLPSVS